MADEKTQPARLGVAGVDRPAMLGVAGVNTRPLQATAMLGVAGNWNPQVRKEVLRIPDKIAPERIGDQAAMVGWQRGVLFCDYQYLVCPDGPDTMRWRKSFIGMFESETRPMLLYLDSGAYRRWSGQAESWDTFERYCQAIDLLRADGYMAYDTFGDTPASLEAYERMRALGYDPIPVWQFRQTWDDRAGDIMSDPWGVLDDVARCAIANARLAAKDPVLQYLCSQSRLVAIGGMARGPCPIGGRVYYLRELCRQFPDNQFWALAQARDSIINGLGRHGLLDQVWTDGSWWIHNARSEQFAIVKDGLISNISLRGQARSFFTLAEMMSANVRSLLGAYSGLWTFPEPPPIPDDPRDMEALRELKKRLQPFQTTLFDLMPGYEEDEPA